MPNIYNPDLQQSGSHRSVRIGEEAGGHKLVGIFDAARPDERRFGALFNVDDAVSDYGGGHAKAQIAPPSRRRGSG
jgi:hypothetical protein